MVIVNCFKKYCTDYHNSDFAKGNCYSFILQELKKY